MKFNRLRKIYFDNKKINENGNQFCSDKKITRMSVRPIMKSDFKKTAFNLQKSSNKENINFNDQTSNKNIKRNLFFSKENKENKENNAQNENTYESKESKDTLDNSINYGNNGYLKNNYFNKRNEGVGRYNKLKLRLSMPLYVENNYNTNNEKDNKKDKCYNMNCNNNTGITFDCEIDDLINSTTSKIENEKEQNNHSKENNEFKKYLEKVKKTKLSKNNLTKGSLAIIQMQIFHAKDAIIYNKYVSYINLDTDDKKDICFRLGKNNMCVCGHGFSKHYLFLCGEEFKSNCKKCECKKFKYIPVFPEETNEYAKAYLLDFKYDDWKAGCKCGHNWTKHNFIKDGICEECDCECFESNFCCGVCGNSWENHITSIQTREHREKNGESFGKDYEPFTQEQMQNLQKD